MIRLRKKRRFPSKRWTICSVGVRQIHLGYHVMWSYQYGMHGLKVRARDGPSCVTICVVDIWRTGTAPLLPSCTRDRVSHGLSFHTSGSFEGMRLERYPMNSRRCCHASLPSAVALSQHVCMCCMCSSSVHGALLHLFTMADREMRRRKGRVRKQFFYLKADPWWFLHPQDGFIFARKEKLINRQMFTASVGGGEISTARIAWRWRPLAWQMRGVLFCQKKQIFLKVR